MTVRSSQILFELPLQWLAAVGSELARKDLKGLGQFRERPKRGSLRFVNLEAAL